MDVIILVGGYAKRLWPLTEDKPKSLLKIMGKEILAYLLENLNNLGTVDQIYVSTNTEFRNHFIDFFSTHNYNLNIELVIEPHTQYSQRLGPIGGLEYIRNNRGAKEYMIIAGDNLFKFRLSDFFNFYQKDKSVIALQLPPAILRGMSQLGIAEVDNADTVTKFEEKPKWPGNTLISTGCYILTQEDFDLVSKYIRTGGKIDSLGTFMRWLAIDRNRGIKGFTFRADWFDVGTLDSLLSANHSYLESGIFGERTGNVDIYDKVYIGEGSIIKDSGIGPDVYIGKNCVIRDSKISDALIYDNVTIDEGVIQHSVIDEGSNVSGSVSGIIATRSR